MKFEEVLPALREGKMIKRKCWREGEYLKIDGEYLERKDCAVLERKLFTDFSLKELLADDWETVKEPKKIKLRDMTESQYSKFRKNCGYEICSTTCPFRYINCAMGWWKHKEYYSDKFLDQEIEIEEE